MPICIGLLPICCRALKKIKINNYQINIQIQMQNKINRIRQESVGNGEDQ